MENDVYEPLAAMILPYLGTKYCDLPDDVRQRVKRAFIVEWDALSPEHRTDMASQYDLQHDPAMEKENAYWEKLSIQIGELKNEIAKWDAKPEPGLPSESILKERKLDALRTGLAKLESRWKLPPFSDSTQSQSQQPQPEQFKTPAATANGPIAAVSSPSREQTVIDALIIKIFRDAARRLLPFNPELGRQWEVDVYAAAFITDELREIWRMGAQKVDWQEIYKACENIVWEVWRRDEPMEKVPQSYLANTDAAPATLSLLPLNHSGHAKMEATSKMSATASVTREATSGPLGISSVTGPISNGLKTANIWGEHGLRTLLSESQQMDMTQQKLADKYGVTRQRIGALLNNARAQFGVKKASPFAALGSGKRR